MTEYVFHREIVTPGDTVDIPDNARDIDYQHKDDVTIVCWFEKQGESVI